MKNFALFVIGLLIGGLAVYFFYEKEGQPLATDLIKPNGLITPSEAKTLDQAFNSRHQLISDSIVKRPDNRSSWYALEDLRNYLTYAEKQAKDLGYAMDGVRVYLGAYPDTDNKIGLTTLFFVPTGHENTSKGSMISIQNGSPDIQGADGLNLGSNGYPPSASYPQ